MCLSNPGLCFAAQARALREARQLTREALACRIDVVCPQVSVSVETIKRFERTGEITLSRYHAILCALNAELTVTPGPD